MRERRLRLPRVGGELLVVARHGDGASIRAHRLGHSAVGTPVVGDQHGRVAVVSGVGGVVEVGWRAVGAHRGAGGHAAGCWVSGLGQTPGAHVGLQVEMLGVLRGAPAQVRHARGSEGLPHPPPPPVVPLLEHVLKRGVQHPEVALPIRSALPGHLQKTLI